jgi:hypothetical protein
MPEDNKEPMVDVGEEQGAEINLDENNEQTKEAVAEEKIEVEQVEEQPVEATEEKKDEKEDELKAYSEGVQKRIAKLTRKMREAERQKEEAIAYAQAEKQRREEYENKYSKLDQSYVSEFENRVKTNTEAARAMLRKAIEDGDVDGQVAAQEQLAKLNSDATQLSVLKKAHEEQSQKPQKEVNITPQQYKEVNTYNGYELPEGAKTDAKAEAWAAKNAWFGNDSAMTYTAFDIHKKLVEEEGFDPQSDEYYSEIDKRIRLEFPNKFDRDMGNSTERAKPAQTVASAKRPSATGRRKTVKLTPSQVAIAKRLGVPLEEYAKQLTTKEA